MHNFNFEQIFSSKETRRLFSNVSLTVVPKLQSVSSEIVSH